MATGPTDTTPQSLSARVDELEIQLAHQTQVIEELNAVVTEQAETIDRLAKRMAMLREQFEAMEDPNAEVERTFKPPHY